MDRVNCEVRTCPLLTNTSRYSNNIALNRYMVNNTAEKS